MNIGVSHSPTVTITLMSVMCSFSFVFNDPKLKLFTSSLNGRRKDKIKNERYISNFGLSDTTGCVHDNEGTYELSLRASL